MKKLSFCALMSLFAVLVLGLSAPAKAASDAPITVACITTAPHLDVITEDGQIVTLLFFALESLVTTEEDGQGGIRIVPSLAESWKISDDGMRDQRSQVRTVSRR